MTGISDAERRNLIVSILITHAKTGCSLGVLLCEFNFHLQCDPMNAVISIWNRFFSWFVYISILGDYREFSGEEMTPSRNESIKLLESMPDAVVCENGLYFSASEKSKHIAKLVVNQHEKNQRPFRPCGSQFRSNNQQFRPNNPPFRPNHNRPIVPWVIFISILFRWQFMKL